MNSQVGWYLGFTLFVLLMLAIDLGVFHRKAHSVSIRESLAWVVVWVSLAMLFNLGIYMGWIGEISPGDRSRKAVEFLTGYVVEYSLSMDNLFLFVLFFRYFSVPTEYQHRVLFWGILGALIMRGIMIAVGAALIARFFWILYVFGVFLIYSGIRIVLKTEEKVDPDHNMAVRIFRKFFPVTKVLHGDRFWVRIDGRWVATPLAVLLVCIEVTDLVFAVDSIPAIFAITLDPFIVYTSNVFAILGLRSLYFALAGAFNAFVYLKYGLGFILFFIGVKILLGHTQYKIEPADSLAVVGLALATSVIASFLFPPRKSENQA